MSNTYVSPGPAFLVVTNLFFGLAGSLHLGAHGVKPETSVDVRSAHIVAVVRTERYILWKS
jgi:hypothetical protein